MFYKDVEHSQEGTKKSPHGWKPGRLLHRLLTLANLVKERIRHARTKIVTSLKLQVTREKLQRHDCIKLSKFERLAENNGLDG